MTLQEIFNKVYLGLMKQKVRSAKKATRGILAAFDAADGTPMMCCYRGENGTKCAAGHLIEDDEYRIGMEGKRFDFVLGVFDDIVSLKQRLGPFVNEIRNLQLIHDTYEPALWEQRFKSFAVDHNLTVPELPAE